MMPRRFLLLFTGLFVCGAAVGVVGFLLSRPAKTGYLPKAQNDLILAAVGVSSEESSGRSIEARTERESYPAGTKEIVLIITNHSEDVLGYTGYYDFRRVDGDVITPLAVRPDVVFDMTDQQLNPSETVRETVPVDLFDEPLPSGTYRAAQLACFSGAQGEALACTEITADFVID